MSRGRLPCIDFPARRARLAEAVATQALDAAWITDATELTWLTGFTGSNGAVLVSGDGRVVFATDARYEGRAPTGDDITVVVGRDLFAVVLAHGGDGSVAFDPTAVTHARALDWQERAGRRLVATSGLVAPLRRRKDDAEVARLALACELTVRAWREVVVAARDAGTLVGRSERELATAIERAMVDLGADAPAFASIVASGPNGGVPHHEPSDRPVGAGELLTTDIGARVDGYHADFTRTIATEGGRDVAEELVEVHAVVVAAQAAGVAAVVPGEPIVTADSAARDVIADAGWGEQFLHGVGHGVGLAIHEDPMIAQAGDAVFAPGMVVTIEPGIYLSGRGGVRIEDTVVVSDTGPRRLTVAPRALDPRP